MADFSKLRFDRKALKMTKRDVLIDDLIFDNDAYARAWNPTLPGSCRRSCTNRSHLQASLRPSDAGQLTQ